MAQAQHPTGRVDRSSSGGRVWVSCPFCCSVCAQQELIRFRLATWLTADLPSNQGGHVKAFPKAYWPGALRLFRVTCLEKLFLFMTILFFGFYDTNLYLTRKTHRAPRSTAHVFRPFERDHTQPFTTAPLETSCNIQGPGRRPERHQRHAVHCVIFGGKYICTWWLSMFVSLPDV